MNDKQEKEPKYSGFLRFIIGWFVFANILHKLPIAPTTFVNAYIVLGIIYSISVSVFYDRKTREFLLFHYYDSCINAMREVFQVPPFKDNEEYLCKRLSLESFNLAVARKMFTPLDDVIFEIKRNNMYWGAFTAFITFHIMIFIAFR